MIRVGVHGFGRMGRLVAEVIARAPDLTLAWSCGRNLPDSLDCDVIVDFSSPTALAHLAAITPAPIVSGTTGGPLPACAVPLLHAANFSLGVAVLAKLVAQARRALPDFDVELVELHHRHKADAPSGTALRLVGPDVVNGHHGLRQPGTVGVHAVRGGDIIGEHTVYLCGPGERLALAHIATDRSVFAEGAVRCARWIVGKPPGRYTLEDVLSG